jgi:hypothetical protein
MITRVQFHLLFCLFVLDPLGSKPTFCRFGVATGVWDGIMGWISMLQCEVLGEWCYVYLLA